MEQYLDSAYHSEAINAHVPLNKPLTKKKLSFKLKSGWVLQNASLYHDGTWSEIENGMKVTVAAGDEIDFWIRDPKGDPIWFYFFFR